MILAGYNRLTLSSTSPTPTPLTVRRSRTLLGQSECQRRYAPMVFGFIPECRSASFRNKRSVSPESPFSFAALENVCGQRFEQSLLLKVESEGFHVADEAILPVADTGESRGYWFRIPVERGHSSSACMYMLRKFYGGYSAYSPHDAILSPQHMRRMDALFSSRLGSAVLFGRLPGLFLDARVGNQPRDCDDDVARFGKPGTHECEGNRRRVDHD